MHPGRPDIQKVRGYRVPEKPACTVSDWPATIVVWISSATDRRGTAGNACLLWHVVLTLKNGCFFTSSASFSPEPSLLSGFLRKSCSKRTKQKEITV